MRLPTNFANHSRCDRCLSDDKPSIHRSSLCQGYEIAGKRCRGSLLIMCMCQYMNLSFGFSFPVCILCARSLYVALLHGNLKLSRFMIVLIGYVVMCSLRLCIGLVINIVLLSSTQSMLMSLLYTPRINSTQHSTRELGEHNRLQSNTMRIKTLHNI